PLKDCRDTCAPDQTMNSVPFTQLPSDIKNQATPNYAYVTPNLDEDAHDGTLPEADQWLNENLPQILGLPEFQPGGDGLMFMVWNGGDLGPDNVCSPKLNTACGCGIAQL